MIQFPKVVGEDLLGNEIRIPAQLSGELNVLVVAFQRWHQKLVDTWVPFLKQLESRYSNTAYYELPTIGKMNKLFRFFINSGMRSGIPSEETRERTITLYIDKEAFDKALSIHDEENIYIYLVRREGSILWQERGSYTDEKGSELEKVLQETISSDVEN